MRQAETWKVNRYEDTDDDIGFKMKPNYGPQDDPPLPSPVLTGSGFRQRWRVVPGERNKAILLLWSGGRMRMIHTELDYSAADQIDNLVGSILE